jgi:hypothetical protein
MSRPVLEVADIFRDHGAAWRRANAGNVSLDHLKVMSAIERCRTAALGGHVARCENEKCTHTIIAYNSCRNRHCPKCQGAAAREWLAEREAELLPVPYFHVVYTLPAEIRDIAYQNRDASRLLLPTSRSMKSRRPGESSSPERSTRSRISVAMSSVTSPRRRGPAMWLAKPCPMPLPSERSENFDPQLGEVNAASAIQATQSLALCTRVQIGCGSHVFSEPA